MGVHVLKSSNLHRSHITGGAFYPFMVALPVPKVGLELLATVDFCLPKSSTGILKG